MEEELTRPTKIKRDVYFTIGEIVYLKADISQYPRIVVGYVLGPPKDEVKYTLRYSDESMTDHLEAEISLTKNNVMTQSYTDNEEE